MTAVAIIGGTLFACAFLLFLGGIGAAAFEILDEKRQGVRVTRPGWNRADREALDRPQDRYRVPRGTGFVWVLVAVGRPDLGERFLAWKAGHRVRG